MSTWRQTATLAADRISEALKRWRIARQLYPTMEREGWNLQHDLPAFSEAIRYDAGFHAWSEAHILQPLQTIDPLADDAPTQILTLSQRLARLTASLRDDRPAESLVWDVPRTPASTPPIPATLPESHLDDTDRALAREIRSTPGIYGTQLAERTHLSESNVHKRMAKKGHLFQLGFHQKAGRKGYFPPEKP